MFISKLAIVLRQIILVTQDISRAMYLPLWSVRSYLGIAMPRTEQTCTIVTVKVDCPATIVIVLPILEKS